MEDTVADFFRATLVPELGADVAAGTPGHIHLVLVRVAAHRAFPHQLAVIFDNLNLAVVAADLAVVALAVQIGRAHV